jgi:hypothetical protein
MEPFSYSEANSYSASQEYFFVCVVNITQVHYRIKNNPPLVSVLNQIILVYIHPVTLDPF